MRIADVANEIYVDMGSPTSTSISAITFWIRGKVGTLNMMLFEDFYINETTQELERADGGGIPYEVAGIIKQLFRLYDLECQIRNNMNALAASSILEIDDQGTSIKRVNRNSISQTFAQIRRDEINILKDLVTSYRMKYGTPEAVHGDDYLYPLGQTYPTANIYYRR